MHHNEMKVIDYNLIKSDINSFVAGNLVELALFLLMFSVYGGVLIGVGVFFLVSDLNAYFSDIEYVIRAVGVAFIVLAVAWLGFPFYCAVSKLIFTIRLLLAKVNGKFSLVEDRLDYISDSASTREKPAAQRELSEFFSRRRTYSRTETAFFFIGNGRASNCTLRGYKFSSRDDMFYLLIVNKTIVAVYPQKIYRLGDC